MKTKKVPMRMCVGCREMKPKRELIRVVRTETGAEVDKTSKAPGRGAYLCLNEACLKRAVKTHALERALESKIDESVYERLHEQLLRSEALLASDATGTVLRDDITRKENSEKQI